jgi:hypothetical protein
MDRLHGLDLSGQDLGEPDVVVDAETVVAARPAEVGVDDQDRGAQLCEHDGGIEQADRFPFTPRRAGEQDGSGGLSRSGEQDAGAHRAVGLGHRGVRLEGQIALRQRGGPRRGRQPREHLPGAFAQPRLARVIQQLQVGHDREVRQAQLALHVLRRLHGVVEPLGQERAGDPPEQAEDESEGEVHALAGAGRP